MDIAMNAQHIRKLREARAWSQEHLADAAGLSLRTIQRVEAEGKASAETRLALAAALDVPVAELSAPEVQAGATASAEPSPVTHAPAPPRRLSWTHYRMLRLGLILAILVGADLYHSGTLTWSRWPLLGIALFVSLRYLRRQYIEPKPKHGGQTHPTSN